MNRKKIDPFKRRIIFKSPIEYKMVGHHGSPVYYITTTDENEDINELLVLNTDTMEYELLETSSDYRALYEKAMKLNYEISDKIRKYPTMEKKEEKIAEILKEQIEKYFEREDD